MISRHGSATADELLLLKEDGCRYELIEGQVIKMSPAGSEHGRIADRISRRMGNFIEQNNLGQTYAAETGFKIASDPDTVRAPDAAFVSHGRLATVEDTHGYLPLAPDLVVEVVSPSDAFSDVEQKAASWLVAGTRIVLVADPRTSTLRVYRGPDVIEVLHLDDTFDAGDVVPGWTLPVRDALGVS